MSLYSAVTRKCRSLSSVVFGMRNLLYEFISSESRQFHVVQVDSVEEDDDCLTRRFEIASRQHRGTWQQTDDETLSISQFLPRCMKCGRGLAMRILSVCLSVRLSVCHTRDP